MHMVSIWECCCLCFCMCTSVCEGMVVTAIYGCCCVCKCGMHFHTYCVALRLNCSTLLPFSAEDHPIDQESTPSFNKKSIVVGTPQKTMKTIHVVMGQRLRMSPCCSAFPHRLFCSGRSGSMSLCHCILLWCGWSAVLGRGRSTLAGEHSFSYGSLQTQSHQVGSCSSQQRLAPAVLPSPVSERL